ncbi:MAG: helix-turn-helix domain-containing protein [Rhodocyclaceae bacterium]|nr:helix-turn-helix domain-containing protein [Rhodocyclaceae bacterium]
MADTIRTSGQLGPILKRLRKARGWSQFALGRKIGLSQERISVIENHPERISIDQLLTLLMALDAELQVVPRTSLAENAAEALATKASGA